MTAAGEGVGAIGGFPFDVDAGGFNDTARISCAAKSGIINSLGFSFFGGSFLNDNAGCWGFAAAALGESAVIRGDDINLLDTAIGRCLAGDDVRDSDISIFAKSSRG